MNNDAEKPKINAKQRRFIASYLESMNAAKAARTAGYSEKAARQLGQRLLTNADIRSEIDQELNKIQEQQKRALIKLADLAVMALQDVVTNGRGLAKVNAANSILDRSGHKPVDHVKSEVNANVTAEISIEDAEQELAEKFNRRYPIGAGEIGDNSLPKPAGEESIIK